MNNIIINSWIYNEKCKNEYYKEQNTEKNEYYYK